jgi:predicted amidohydrolase
MQTLTVSIVQAELHWHDADKNLDQFAAAIESIDNTTDLIVLPEMFTSGFTMDAAANAEPMDGRTIAWMRDRAVFAQASVCGSLIIEEDGRFYNRFIYMPPQGDLHYYDKRHLFRLADEQRHYSPGDEHTTFELNGFRICPMICYDLRFPVWSRNQDDYDVLVYVANWPNRRQFAWDTLLRARAIENLSYVVGVNRNGLDGNDLPYSGGSCIVDFLGADLANLQDRNGVASATLDKKALMDFRERFAFDKDADAFSIDP